jgi:hypothetical protein
VRLIVFTVRQGATYCLEIPRLFRRISARLPEFSDHGPDASLFDPLPPAEFVDLAPFTAWSRRAIGHEHVELLPGSMSLAVGWH